MNMFEKHEALVLNEFHRWWQIYPRKVGKKAAERAYRQAVARLQFQVQDPFEKLLRVVERYADSGYVRSHKKLGTMQYVPHPASWLNGERYDDDPAEWDAGPETKFDKLFRRELGDK